MLDCDLMTIDYGNSSPHLGKFKAGEFLGAWPLKEKVIWEAQNFRGPIIVSNVGANFERLNIPSKYLFLPGKWKKNNQFLDMKMKYSDTIGDDRIIQSYYLFNKRAQELPLLFIDAGTFTTFDFIHKDGLEGGFIFPGVQTFLKSFDQGADLPYISSGKINFNEKIHFGNSTTEAMNEAIKIYLKGIIKIIREEFPHYSKVVLTGGQASTLHPFLSEENTDILLEDKHLIHKSLAFLQNHFGGVQ